jgi:type IV pilus assembly protein PilQ
MKLFIDMSRSELPKRPIMRRLAVGVMLVVSVCAAAAQNVIQAVTGQYKGGLEVLTIKAQDVITVDPVGFATQSPARIAFDFVGFGSSVERGAIPLGLKNAKSASVIQANDRTRVVVNLQHAAPYMIARSGSTFEIQLADVGASTPTKPAETASFGVAVEAGAASVKDIDFRKAPDGAGRLVVGLSSSSAEADINVRGKALVIDLPRHSLPLALRRKLDVSDFATPVQSVLSETTPTGVRITINPKGNWEHSAFQSEGRLVVDVRDQKIDPDKLVQGVGYAGEKLSLNFQNIEVRSLLQVIADFTGFNIVTSDTVSGAVTLRLKDVPWDQALDIIMQSKGLGMRKNGTVIWVAPKDELIAKEKADLEAKVSVESLEALRTQSFRMNYAKAADIANQLKPAGAGAPGTPGQTASGSILSSRGSVVAEPRTNQLFVTDIPSRLAQVQELINKLDIPIRQVLIEARIVEADDKFGKSLGVRLGGADLRTIRGGDAGYNVGGGNRLAVGGNYNAISATTGAFEADGLNTNSSNFFNLPASGLGGASPATFALSLFKPSANRFLNLELSALEADSRGKIVSSPRLITADQVKAIIEQGVEFPYQTTAPNGGTTIAFKKASLKLEVTPQITPEGGIILDVEVNKDSPGEILLGARAINTKRVQTQVLIESGGTVVIGGIFESNENEAETKVPYLGDVPMIGNLFKSRNRSNNRSELLVFITPKVISESVIR